MTLSPPRAVRPPRARHPRHRGPAACRLRWRRGDPDVHDRPHARALRDGADRRTHVRREPAAADGRADPDRRTDRDRRADRGARRTSRPSRPRRTSRPRRRAPRPRRAAAAACTGSDDNRVFYAGVADAVAWDVYCPVLPTGWFVETGTFTASRGGKMEISYKGPGGRRIAIRRRRLLRRRVRLPSFRQRRRAQPPSAIARRVCWTSATAHGSSWTRQATSTGRPAARAWTARRWRPSRRRSHGSATSTGSRQPNADPRPRSRPDAGSPSAEPPSAEPPPAGRSSRRRAGLAERPTGFMHNGGRNSESPGRDPR